MDPFLHVWDIENPEAELLVAIAAGAILIYQAFWFWRRRRKKNSPPNAH